jgi:hypothetical protein
MFLAAWDNLPGSVFPHAGVGLAVGRSLMLIAAICVDFHVYIDAVWKLARHCN